MPELFSMKIPQFVYEESPVRVKYSDGYGYIDKSYAIDKI
jgi:hypothetical protein